MRIRRRTRSVVAIILIVVVLLVVAIRRGSKPSTKLSTRADREFFSWRAVKVRYPARNLKSLPTGQPKKFPQIQHDFPVESITDRRTRLERQAAVKQVFLRCWSSYRKKAWLKDELNPISGNFRDRFGGWGVTLVDSLDTLWVMDLEDELTEAIEAVSTIDFKTATEKYIDVFETTIRYLGGLLSAFELTSNKSLLRKAIEIGEMLLVAFDTPNHMPMSRWDWQKAAEGHSQLASERTSAAELGSLTLEFTRLSQITGDPIWYDKVARITSVFASQQSKTKIPGLWPVSVNSRSSIVNNEVYFSLGGMSDSLYEYLSKAYLLLGGLEKSYKTMYLNAIKAATTHLIFRPMTPEHHDILLLGDAYASSQRDITLDPQVQHLGCFLAGTLAHSSKIFSEPSHLDTAHKLLQGCIWAYNVSTLGIMPESMSVVPCNSQFSKSTKSCPWDFARWKSEISARKYHNQQISINDSPASSTHRDEKEEPPLPEGITSISNLYYLLRPELIESLFIMYRVTGDRSLPEVAWTIFNRINEATKTEFGNAEVESIFVDHTASSTGESTTNSSLKIRKRDRMESYWLSETLKYFYLIFSEVDVWSLDEVVFSTEGHPFKIRP